MKTFLSEFKTAFLLTVVLVVFLCGVYPLVVWAGGQFLFPGKANGSLLVDKDGSVRGSTLLAQNFSSAKYFHPRPSAAGSGYDATSSSGTNLGPTSSKLAIGIHSKDANGKDLNDPNNFDGIKDLVAAYRSENDLKDTEPVPADAVTRSASGLDPHISIANATIQATRVAKSRHLSAERVNSLIGEFTDGSNSALFGEPGVNVLRLNRALDQLGGAREK
jgi:K+-transporting ATPase ATPase C chain